MTARVHPDRHKPGQRQYLEWVEACAFDLKLRQRLFGVRDVRHAEASTGRTIVYALSGYIEFAINVIAIRGRQESERALSPERGLDLSRKEVDQSFELKGLESSFIHDEIAA